MIKLFKQIVGVTRMHTCFLSRRYSLRIYKLFRSIYLNASLGGLTTSLPRHEFMNCRLPINPNFLSRIKLSYTSIFLEITRISLLTFPIFSLNNRLSYSLRLWKVTGTLQTVRKTKIIFFVSWSSIFSCNMTVISHSNILQINQYSINMTNFCCF